MNTTIFSAQVIGYIGFVKKLDNLKGPGYSVSIGVTVPATNKAPETTEWVEGVLQGPQAKALGEYLHPGRIVYASGPYTNVRFTKKDGSPGMAGRIRINEFRFLDVPETE